MSFDFSAFNPEQQAAVQHGSGPAVVLAGAGSGKTRVLTSRAAWLIQAQQVLPESILLATFTNKAAGEMSRRVQEMTGSPLPFSGTFHSFCAKLLRQHAELVGLQTSFTIFDANDQKSLVNRVLKELGSPTLKQTGKPPKPQAILGTIGTAKNELLSPEEYSRLAQDDYQELVARVYRSYQRALQKQNAVDFDDLLNLVVQILSNNSEILSKYQTQWEYVLVDEYQDTNKAQYLLTHMLAEPQQNIFVVGDFSQSIYAWRGADYRNLQRLYSDYPTLAEYRLEQNYRSTQTILSAATEVISHNTSHPVLKLWTKNTQAEKVHVLEAADHEDEANWITRIITTQSAASEYGNIAILYRTNAQSRPFEEAFVHRGVPYRVVGGLKFYERKEIKDLLAYMRVANNPLDLVSQDRVLKNGKRTAAIFTSWVEAHQDEIKHQTPLFLLENILSVTHYQDKLDPKDEEDAERLENIKELLNVASQFETATQLLENIALVQDGYLKDLQTAAEGGGVTLMSLHSAKGLEFPIVFMVGMEEGLLPHSRSLWDKEQMEEERRLCYVGITRARTRLYFSHALKRWTYGTGAYTTRSRFIAEIDPELLDLQRSHNDLRPTRHTDLWSTNRYSAKSNPTTKTSRAYIPLDEGVTQAELNDPDLDAFLKGEIDLDSFLK